MIRKKLAITSVLMVGCLFPLLIPNPALAQQQPNPERNAYFGETHIHTSWSFDAYVFGNMKTGPEDAYKFAMGQPIEHPAGYEDQNHASSRFHGGDRPLRVCGHCSLANDPNSDISKLPIAEKLKVRSKEDVMKCTVYGCSLQDRE